MTSVSVPTTMRRFGAVRDGRRRTVSDFRGSGLGNPSQSQSQCQDQ